MRVLILNLDVEDSSGEILDGDGLTLAEGLVPVNADYAGDIDSAMGHAYLERVGSQVFANITPYRGREEALLAMYPGVGGSTFERNGKHLTRFTVNMVGVHITKNADHSIKTIGEQLEAT